MAGNISKEDIRILDFGCGSGLLIDDLNRAVYPNVDGFDAYSEQYCRLPPKDYYHIVIMVEVIEHLAANYQELDLIYKSLLPNGRVMIETGIINAALEDGHSINEWFYVDPAAGHSTIFTVHGLDSLLCQKGFAPRQAFCNYVKHYQKIAR
jgi:2-polyprenyl-3-methyl-5-hydroxy-6-metoxy-1,4-benzoquinol methylase